MKFIDMKSKLFIRILLLIVFSGVYSIDFTHAQDNKVYSTATVMPSFPGGKDALAKFLKANTKYPAAADSAHTTGIVTVSFIVEKNGALSSIDVVKSIGHGCDAEALRVVRKMPKWNPGSLKGKTVRVNSKVSIKFPQ